MTDDESIEQVADRLKRYEAELKALREEVVRLTKMAVEAAELAEHYREENAVLRKLL